MEIVSNREKVSSLITPNEPITITTKWINKAANIKLEDGVQPPSSMHVKANIRHFGCDLFNFKSNT
jgi:hypothetical protein